MITINGRVFENTYSSAQWAEANPVLLNRVLGFDTTVKSFKMGDGVTHWLDLPFYCLAVYDAGTGILMVGNTLSLDEDYTDSLYAKLSESYVNPSWITSLAYSKLTGAPTDLSDFINDVNFINQAGARSALSAAGNLSYNPATGVFSYTQPTNISAFSNDANYINTAGARAAVSAGGSLVYNSTTGVFTYTQPTNVSAFTNDAGYLILTTGDARYPQLSVAYVNPAFIASIPWSKITSAPTTLAGYGITDPIVLTSGSYNNPSWLTALAWSKITGAPTTIAGYGITDFNTLGDARYLQLTGGTLMGSINSQTILPVTNNTYNLGSTTFIFANGYLGALTVDIIRPRTTGGIALQASNGVALGSFSNTGTLTIPNANLSGLTASLPVFTDASKNIVTTSTPAFPTGSTAVTQAAGDNSTKIATTAYVDRLHKGSITLVAGVGSATVSGLTTSSIATIGIVSIGGTVTTTWQYKVVCTVNTITITAITNAGTTNTSDTSVIQYMAIN